MKTSWLIYFLNFGIANVKFLRYFGSPLSKTSVRNFYALTSTYFWSEQSFTLGYMCIVVNKYEIQNRSICQLSLALRKLRD